MSFRGGRCFFYSLFTPNHISRVPKEHISVQIRSKVFLNFRNYFLKAGIFRKNLNFRPDFYRNSKLRDSFTQGLKVVERGLDGTRPNCLSLAYIHPILILIIIYQHIIIVDNFPYNNQDWKYSNFALVFLLSSKAAGLGVKKAVKSFKSLSEGFRLSLSHLLKVVLRKNQSHNIFHFKTRHLLPPLHNTQMKATIILLLWSLPRHKKSSPTWIAKGLYQNKNPPWAWVSLWCTSGKTRT